MVVPLLYERDNSSGAYIRLISKAKILKIILPIYSENHFKYLIKLLNEQKDAVNKRFSEAIKSEDVNIVKLTLFLIKTAYDSNLSSLFDHIRREEKSMDMMLDIYKSLTESTKNSIDDQDGLK